ncbi:MAG: serine hydrolase [Acidobacteria bacterium]|nr:serine hydrolase [Acidobacteriota bacterium]
MRRGGSRSAPLFLGLVAVGAFVVTLARFSSTADVEPAAPAAVPAAGATPAAAPTATGSERGDAPRATESALVDAPRAGSPEAPATAGGEALTAEPPPAGDARPTIAPERSAPRVLELGGVRPPRRIRSAAALIYNPATDEVLWASNLLDRRPIASITKVMTALVLLEHGRDLTLDVVVSGRDVRRASTTHVRRRERVTLDDLLHLALVASDNAAARAIARGSPGGTRGFVERMNRMAAELGLDRTRFVDPSGLDERNVSSPYDVARLVARAMEKPVLARVMALPSYRFRTGRRPVAVRNTNRLVRERADVRGGKTGYIREAGYCLATVVESREGIPLVVVVLGARSNAERFAEVRRLTDWVRNEGRPLVAGSRRRDAGAP